MRSTIILAAIAGLAASSPVTNPQDIDLTLFDAAASVDKTGPPVGAVDDVVDYEPSAAASSAAVKATESPVEAKRHVKRGVNDACAKQPDGYGPVSSPDNYDSFMADPQYDIIAENSLTPDGYSRSFCSLAGSVEGNGYLGLYTLKTFDTIQCQQRCDAAPACYGFNVFMERNPKYNPADSCQDPVSITNYKCTLWGYQVTSEAATNKGQWRNKFHVGIRGSNGYAKLAAPPSYANFTGPVELGGAIQAPRSYMGQKYYPGPYDPSQCAASCQATTAYDSRHPRKDGTYDACNFFNSYVLSKNGVPQGTYCSMYTTGWDKSYSTNVGQYRGSDYYSVSQSYSYTLTNQDSGKTPTVSTGYRAIAV